ncbi:putative quinol monooxygenase [Pyruvatibacter sp.]|uniref:putative quinol monooxygenase n=1 Tax=Pyruvatibacter sp. TaxID=1981328 RepID=UPI0032EC1C55
MAAVGIVATLIIQAGKEAEFEAVFKDLRAQVLANEKGCEMYDVYRSKADASTYVIMERYQDADALKAHGESAHFKAAGPKLGAVLGGAPVLDYLDPVE